MHFTWVNDSVLHACVCMGCECWLWESDHSQGVTWPTGVPAPGETRVYAPFLGDLCVSVCVCAGGALNSRSWSGAVACKAAREAGDPGPATAETACLRSFTRRGGGP